MVGLTLKGKSVANLRLTPLLSLSWLKLWGVTLAMLLLQLLIAAGAEHSWANIKGKNVVSPFIKSVQH